MAPIRPAKGSKKSKASEASGRRTVNCENTPPPSSTKAPTIRRSLTERYKVLEKKLEETTGVYHHNCHACFFILMLTKWLRRTTGERNGIQESSGEEYPEEYQEYRCY
jgi:hypothetical protein